MSCNGCRVLRKGCSENCTLRTSLQWIQNPEAQGHATLFVAKFFGRADLMSFISAVPHHQRVALFQSLLFEACGRTVNPVNGAVGLLCSGNWHICQSAVQTVLSGGVLRPIPPEVLARVLAPAGGSPNAFRTATAAPPASYDRPLAACGKSSGMHFQPSDLSLSPVGGARGTTSFESEVSEDGDNGGRQEEVKLLNLFV
ncbi:hypothetical protein V2J09_023837 [Rumex salicifolius]